MKRQFLIHFLLIFFATVLTLNVSAQNEYTLNNKNSKLIITGTSNLHDWQMEAKQMSGKTRLAKENTNTIDISQVTFTCPVESIKSDHQIMDNKTYNALEEKKHPDIVFQLDTTEDVELKDGKALIKGELTIAGETREVELPCTFNFQKDNQFTVSGEIGINMEDYKVDPPTALLGTLKTDKEVSVKYDLQFENSSDITSNKN